MQLIRLMFRSTLLWLFVFTSTACTAQYTRSLVDNALTDVGLQSASYVQREQQWRFNQSANIAIITRLNDSPSDAPRSSNRLRHDLHASFSRYFTHIYPIDNAETRFSAIYKALAAGCEYAVFAELQLVDEQLSSSSEWQEGAHQHPGKRRGSDRYVVHVQIYDSYSGRLLERAYVQGHSGLFHRDELQAMDLFADGLDLYVRQLAGLAAPSSS